MTDVFSDGTPVPDDSDGPRSNVTPIARARKKRRERATRPGERTELEISEMFVERAQGELRYCGPLGGWHSWTGTHWQSDVLERARELAKDVARELGAEAAALLDADTFATAKRAGSARGVSAILDLARSAPGVIFAPTDADRDPWALNCTNGTIDLRTCEQRPHRREDLITRCTAVAYDPQASSPRFVRFLAEVLPDPEVRAFVGRLAGYAAIGVVREHALGVLWGSGANGKSVLADAVTYVLGGYARSGPSTLVVATGHDVHPCDVATLVGSRLVVVHETRRGAAFDAAKVKLLTGGDRLTARHMRQDFFEFSPSHTMVMLSNYRPSADSSDAALWRRVHLVPFDVVIPPEQRDPTLAETLRAEGPGVLRWIVEGAREWQRIGLAPPDAVRRQTEQYRASEDVIGAFLDECTVRMAQASVKAGQLYQAFTKWCETNGHRTVRGNDFANEIIARGVERIERNTGRVYQGLGLRTDDSEGR